MPRAIELLRSRLNDLYLPTKYASLGPDESGVRCLARWSGRHLEWVELAGVQTATVDDRFVTAPDLPGTLTCIQGHVSSATDDPDGVRVRLSHTNGRESAAWVVGGKGLPRRWQHVEVCGPATGRFVMPVKARTGVHVVGLWRPAAATSGDAASPPASGTSGNLGEL